MIHVTAEIMTSFDIAGLDFIDELGFLKIDTTERSKKHVFSLKNSLSYLI